MDPLVRDGGVSCCWCADDGGMKFDVSVERRFVAIVLMVVAVEMELLTFVTFVSSMEMQMFLLDRSKLSI